MIIRAEEGKIIIELNEHEKELSINEDEVTLANRALNRFVNLGLDANRLVLKQNTTSYATISYRGNSFDWDLIRFKYTNRAKWVSVSMSSNERKEYEHSPIFAAQKNKRQAMWKAQIESIEDVDLLTDIAFRYIKEIMEKFPEKF